MAIMNEMYSLSIEIHLGAIAAFALLSVYNGYSLYKSNDIKTYSVSMRMYVPISLMLLISMFFTGIVMMASKWLPFDWFNVLMILANINLIAFEIYRYQRLKKVDPRDEKSVQNYRDIIFKIFTSELFIIISFYILKDFR